MRRRTRTVLVCVLAGFYLLGCQPDNNPPSSSSPKSGNGSQAPADSPTSRLKLKLRATLPGAGIPFALTGDSKTLATDINYDRIRLWEVDTGKEHPSLQGATDPIALTADGKLLAACTEAQGGQAHDILLWDVAAGKALKSFKGHT